jgi:flagellar motor switch protein FliM
MDAPEAIVAPENEAPVADTGAPNISARPSAQLSARPVDFRHPVFLSSAEWRKLRMDLDELAASTGSLLSTYLRLDFGLQVGRLQMLGFSEFIASLASPTHLILFKTDPLRGIGVTEIKSGIAQAVVDRLLGGPGKPSAPERQLTDMETALMDQFVQLALEEWCRMWSKLQPIEPEILGHENNPKFLQCATPDTMMLVLVLEARLGETEGQIQFAFPYSALEPLVNKLAELAATAAPKTGPAAVSATKWTQHLDKVSVRLSAQWPALKIPTRSLVELQVGSVLDFNPTDAERLELRVGKVVKFRGRLGTRDQKWAIQITEVCKL